jgi:hypothetical protein
MFDTLKNMSGLGGDNTSTVDAVYRLRSALEMSSAGACTPPHLSWVSQQLDDI